MHYEHPICVFILMDEIFCNLKLNLKKMTNFCPNIPFLEFKNVLKWYILDNSFKNKLLTISKRFSFLKSKKNFNLEKNLRKFELFSLPKSGIF